MAPSHLQIGNLVSEARDKNNEGPVVGLHHHPSSLGTAHMEGGGAAAVRALHTTASVPFPPLLTKDTPLHRKERVHNSMGWPSISSCFLSKMHKTKPSEVDPLPICGSTQGQLYPCAQCKVPMRQGSRRVERTRLTRAKMHSAPQTHQWGARQTPSPLRLTSLKRGRGILLTSTGLLSAMLTNLASKIATAHET